ncbi:MAG: hypothetical protein ACP5FK_10580 [bacterium]
MQNNKDNILPSYKIKTLNNVPSEIALSILSLICSIIILTVMLIILKIFLDSFNLKNITPYLLAIFFVLFAAMAAKFWVIKLFSNIRKNWNLWNDLKENHQITEGVILQIGFNYSGYKTSFRNLMLIEYQSQNGTIYRVINEVFWGNNNFKNLKTGDRLIIMYSPLHPQVCIALPPK